MIEILDISKTAIKLIEIGFTKYPSKKVLQNLSAYLKLTEHEVMMNILFTDKDLSNDASSVLLIDG